MVERTAAMIKIPNTSIDLFAGCGGLSLGLHRAGWSPLFAIERDPMAFETLSHNLCDPAKKNFAFQNWPDWLPQEPIDLRKLMNNQDARDQLRRLKGKVGLIAGGPPCQGFSVGGSRNGSDERNELVHLQLEMTAMVEPPIVLIENVEGMTRPFRSKPDEQGVAMTEVIADELDALGYEPAITVVDASDFGVPQRRRRVLIVGLDRTVFPSGEVKKFASAIARVGHDMREDFGLPVDRPVNVAEALDDLASRRTVVCPDSPKFMSGTYLKPRSAYAELMRRDVEGGIPDSHRFSKHGERIVALYELAHETQKPGRLSREFLLSQGTKKHKKVLLDPSEPASTITTHPDEFIHHKEPRNITVREMARLQSFPDDFAFRGRYTINGERRKLDVARCSQVGNAVPPLMGEAVGRALLNISGALGARPDRLKSPELKISRKGKPAKKKVSSVA